MLVNVQKLHTEHDYLPHANAFGNYYVADNSLLLLSVIIASNIVHCSYNSSSNLNALQCTVQCNMFLQSQTAFV